MSQIARTKPTPSPLLVTGAVLVMVITAPAVVVGLWQLVFYINLWNTDSFRNSPYRVDDGVFWGWVIGVDLAPTLIVAVLGIWVLVLAMRGSRWAVLPAGLWSLTLVGAGIALAVMMDGRGRGFIGALLWILLGAPWLPMMLVVAGAIATAASERRDPVVYVAPPPYYQPMPQQQPYPPQPYPPQQQPYPPQQQPYPPQPYPPQQQPYGQAPQQVPTQRADQ